MVDVVINPYEVSLNSKRYKIEAPVREQMLNRFPGKITFGDYSYDNEQFLSNLNLSDQRGGILVEEMEESIHTDRCWWSTCNLAYKGHIILPRLATEVAPPAYDDVIHNAGFEAWTGGVPDNWTVSGDDDDIDISQDADEDSGTYAVKWAWESGDGTDFDELLYQDISWDVKYRNVLVTFAINYKMEYENKALTEGDIKVEINDGVGTTASSGGESTSYTSLSVTRRIHSTATRLRVQIRFTVDDAGDRDKDVAGWADTCTLAFPSTSLATAALWENFNNNLYHIAGESLLKLNGAADGWTHIHDWVGETPSALKTTPDGYLMIGLGDSTVFDYMNTSESMASHAAESGATFLIQWDGKMFKMDASGNMEYHTDITTNPWTDADSGGSLGDYNVTPKRLSLYRDSDGEVIVYCGTTKGLYAYDFGNSKWVETELSLPEHATCGLGLLHWRDAFYVSAGLDVHRYVVGQTAVIQQVGLNNDAGLPATRGGEIVEFIKGYNEMFALVDSTYEGASSRSTVMSYDGKGWQVFWMAGADNLAMRSGIVSSVVAHNLWFSVGTTNYKIPLQKNIRNPNQLSTFTYDTGGLHIYGYFDAGSKISKKLIKRVRLFCKCTVTENCIIRYRIDHSNTDISTGWTTLGTISGDGVTEWEFGTNGVGIVCYDIQLMFDLARGGTSTNTPDVMGVSLSYLKLTEPKYGWGVSIVIDGDYAGQSARQQWANLKTAADTDTLLEFTFRNDSGGSETNYVKIHPMSRLALQSGDNFGGKTQLFLIAV